MPTSDVVRSMFSATKGFILLAVLDAVGFGQELPVDSDTAKNTRLFRSFKVVILT